MKFLCRQFKSMWGFLKFALYFGLLILCLAAMALLLLLMVQVIILSLVLNCVTIPVYTVVCAVDYFQGRDFPRVGYFLLTMYPTRRQTADTSTFAEFMILVGTLAGFLLAVILLLDGLLIPGLLGAVVAVVVWWKFCPKPHPEKLPGNPQLTKAVSKFKRGIDFEEYCGAYLLKHGFHDVVLTPPSGDYGADIVAKDSNGVTWVFQCKHYHSKVGNSCVQEIVAAKRHYGAARAAVMTNSRLTEKAKELAWENDVLLYEGLGS